MEKTEGRKRIAGGRVVAMVASSALIASLGFATSGVLAAHTTPTDTVHVSGPGHGGGGGGGHASPPGHGGGGGGGGHASPPGHGGGGGGHASPPGHGH